MIEKRDTLNFGYPEVICALPPMSIAAFNVTAVFQVYKQDCSIMGIHFESNFPVYAFALGGVHKLRLQEEGGRWSKKIDFL